MNEIETHSNLRARWRIVEVDPERPGWVCLKPTSYSDYSLETGMYFEVIDQPRGEE